MVSDSAVPPVSEALPVKLIVLPTSRSETWAGERLTTAGTGPWAVVVTGELELQPASKPIMPKAVIAATTKTNLPIHPPRPMAAHRASTYYLENCQCRGCESFQQVEAFARRLSRAPKSRGTRDLWLSRFVA